MAGRRDFCQSILTYRLEPMCAVKINMPKIFKCENRPKTVVQSAFLYLDIVSVCGGAVAFSNTPFRQWTGPNNSSNVDDLQMRWGLMWATVVGENVNKIMFTNRWCHYTTRKTNCNLPNSQHLKLTMSTLKKTFWTHFVIFVDHKKQNLLTVVTFRRLTKGPKFLDCSVFSKCFERITPIFTHCLLLQALCLGALWLKCFF